MAPTGLRNMPLYPATQALILCRLWAAAEAAVRSLRPGCDADYLAAQMLWRSGNVGAAAERLRGSAGACGSRPAKSCELLRVLEPWRELDLRGSEALKDGVRIPTTGSCCAQNTCILQEHLTSQLQELNAGLKGMHSWVLCDCAVLFYWSLLKTVDSHILSQRWLCRLGRSVHGVRGSLHRAAARRPAARRQRPGGDAAAPARRGAVRAAAPDGRPRGLGRGRPAAARAPRDAAAEGAGVTQGSPVLSLNLTEALLSTLSSDLSKTSDPQRSILTAPQLVIWTIELTSMLTLVTMILVTETDFTLRTSFWHGVKLHVSPAQLMVAIHAPPCRIWLPILHVDLPLCSLLQVLNRAGRHQDAFLDLHRLRAVVPDTPGLLNMLRTAAAGCLEQQSRGGIRVIVHAAMRRLQ